MAKARHIGKIVVSHDQAIEPSGLVRSDSSYLVTGGAGGIGSIVGRWLIDRGAGRVILLGRRSGDQLSQEVVEQLQMLGSKLQYIQADVSDQVVMQAMASKLDTDLPIRGIVHAAGILDDDIIVNQNSERLRAVAAPKVGGAWNLHEISAGWKLDFFVMFSSIAPLLGSHGQGTYAAANAYLDGFAAYRRTLGLPATSINWGPWEAAGMATRSASTAKHWHRIGLGMLSKEQALYALEKALVSNQAGIVAMTADWGRLGESLVGGQRLAVLTRLVGSRAKSSGPSELWLKLIDTIKTAPVSQRRSMLLEFMFKEARDVLALPPDYYIDPTLPFNEYGFDSLMAVELANRIVKESAIHLPATTLFDYSTMDALADFILSEKLSLIPSQKATPFKKKVDESVEEMTARLLNEVSLISDQENSVKD